MQCRSAGSVSPPRWLPDGSSDWPGSPTLRPPNLCPLHPYLCLCPIISFSSTSLGHLEHHYQGLPLDINHRGMKSVWPLTSVFLQRLPLGFITSKQILGAIFILRKDCCVLCVNCVFKLSILSHSSLVNPQLRRRAASRRKKRFRAARKSTKSIVLTFGRVSGKKGRF